MALRDWPDVPDMPDKDAGEPTGPARGDQRAAEQRIADRDTEAPEADVAEQVTPASPADEADEEPPPRITNHPEAGEYDAIEQHRAVAYDDEYSRD